MNKSARPPLPNKQAQTLAFVQVFARKNYAFPGLKTIAEGTGLTTSPGAKVHVDELVRKGYLARTKGKPHNAIRIVDEPQIPVIATTRGIDPAEPLVSESRIIETVRGVLAETFNPEPDFLAQVESKSGCTELIAIRIDAQPQDGARVIGRLRDTIVLGRVRGRHIVLETCRSENERRARSINRTHPDFRIDGVVVGTITAQSLQIKD